MTREEAVAIIKDHIEIHKKISVALDMAIKALEQPEIIRCKDCSNGGDWYTADDGSRYCYCMETSDCRMENFYCADAEKGHHYCMTAIDTLKYLLAKAESDIPEGSQIVGLDVPVDIVREIIDTQPEQRWILCSERMPEVGQKVRFSVGGMYTAEGCLRADGEWEQYRWDEISLKDKVVAWMPMPEED